MNWFATAALLTILPLSLLTACGGDAPNPATTPAPNSVPDTPASEPTAVPKLAAETVVVNAATNKALTTFGFDNAALCVPSPELPALKARTGQVPDLARQPTVACQGRFVFKAGAPQLQAFKPGSILVSPPVDGKAPYGYLQRVKSLSTEGGLTTIITEQASLDQALIEGEFDEQAKLKPANLAALSLAPGVSLPGTLGVQSLADHPEGVTFEGQALRALDLQNFAFDVNSVLYDADGNTSSTNDQVRLSGHFNLDVDNGIGVKIRWKKLAGIPIYPKGITFRAAYGFSQSADLRVEAGLQTDLDKEVELAQYTFSPITFFVGPVPVVLVPSVKITADLKGNVSAKLAFGASEHLTARAGFEYDGDFHNISEFSKGFDRYADIPAVTGKAELGLNLRGDMLLYGVVGPYARVRASMAFDGAQPRDPAWTLTAAAKLYAGIHADLLVTTLDWDTELYSLPPFQFAQSGPLPPTIKFVDPKDGIKVQRGSGTVGELCVYVSDPQQGHLPASVTANGAGIGSTDNGIYTNCLAPPANVYGKPGPVTFVATVSNKYGLSATASSTVTVENVPPSIYIKSPVAGQVVYDGVPFIVQGYVVSGSDRIECPLASGTSMVFSSNIPGDVPPAITCPGNGSLPTTTFKGTGQHILYLNATDTTGAAGERAQVVVNVQKAPVFQQPAAYLLSPLNADKTSTSVNAGSIIPLHFQVYDPDSSTVKYVLKYREGAKPWEDVVTGEVKGANQTSDNGNGAFLDLPFAVRLGKGCNHQDFNFDFALQLDDGSSPKVLSQPFPFKVPFCIG